MGLAGTYAHSHTVKFETSKDEIVSLLNGFKEKFAPEVLKSLSDNELLGYPSSSFS